MLTLQGSLMLKVETKTGRNLRASIFKESKEINTYMCILSLCDRASSL